MDQAFKHMSLFKPPYLPNLLLNMAFHHSNSNPKKDNNEGTPSHWAHCYPDATTVLLTRKLRKQLMGEARMGFAIHKESRQSHRVSWAFRVKGLQFGVSPQPFERICTVCMYTCVYMGAWVCMCTYCRISRQPRQPHFISWKNIVISHNSRTPWTSYVSYKLYL